MRETERCFVLCMAGLLMGAIAAVLGILANLWPLAWLCLGIGVPFFVVALCVMPPPRALGIRAAAREAAEDELRRWLAGRVGGTGGRR